MFGGYRGGYTGYGPRFGAPRMPSFGAPVRPLRPPRPFNATADAETASTVEVLADTFICGECRFITSAMEKFVEHRKEPCRRKELRHEAEPQKLECFTCGEQCDSSWALIDHLAGKHKLCMYKK